MGATENAGFNAEAQRSIRLDFFYNRTAQIIAKTSRSLQLGVNDTLTRVHLPTFATADRRCGGLIRRSDRQTLDRFSIKTRRV